MAAKSKSENAKAAAEAGVKRDGWSIPEWCAMKGISEGLYRKLRKKGREEGRDYTPREKEMGRRKIITKQADADWERGNPESANVAYHNDERAYRRHHFGYGRDD